VKLKNLKVWSASFLLIIMMLPFSLIKAQNSFEGKIKFKTQDETGNVSFMTYYMQNGNTRIDMQASEMGEKTYVIFKSKTMYTVIPSRKMYIEYKGSLDKLMNSKSPDDLSSQSKPKPDNEDNQNWKEAFDRAKTGNTKTILGYKCTEFLFPDSDDRSETSFWATKDFGNVKMMQNPSNQDPLFSFVKYMGGFFPLSTEEKDANGKVAYKAEAVEINKKKLDNSLFDVPENYKKMSVPFMK